MLYITVASSPGFCIEQIKQAMEQMKPKNNQFRRVHKANEVTPCCFELLDAVCRLQSLPPVRLPMMLKHVWLLLHKT
jgi:hypothetical protein